jgi:hypothetical protein
LAAGRAPKWFLSACFGHRPFILWLFDGIGRGQQSHTSIEGLRPTAPKACGNHPGGRLLEGRHIQGLAFAGFLLGGMNFMRHSNPPGSDRRAGRLWPQGPQHYPLGPPQRGPWLAFARHPGRSRLQPSGLPAAAAKAMISPAADVRNIAPANLFSVH